MELNVLVSCEYSGVVRDAFIELGHNAMSCDLLATDSPGSHYQGSVLDVMDDGWDCMIAHPPCTHLSVSGARQFAAKRLDGRQQGGIDFFMKMINAKIPSIGVENPVCIMSTVFRKPDQTVQPWMFGHMEQKATCLWLKNLPLLVPTNNVRAEMMLQPRSVRERIHLLPPSPDRWKLRSVTYKGLADAMARQWSDYIIKQKKEAARIIKSAPEIVLKNSSGIVFN